MLIDEKLNKKKKINKNKDKIEDAIREIKLINKQTVRKLILKYRLQGQQANVKNKINENQTM